MIRLLIPAAIAIFMLFLYGYVVYEAVCLIHACDTGPPVSLNDGQKTIITLVGGLVSALVVSLLAATPPGTSPVQTVIASAQPATLTGSSIPISELSKNITTVITYAYLTAWLVIGICAVYFGFLKECKSAPPELAIVAKSWLGIAIASVYAFFGLKAA